MSFQSQLLGATTAVLGAKEQQDAIKETENKRQLENQYQSELDALREKEADDQRLFKTLEEQTVYKGEKTIPVREGGREDGKLKGFVNVKVPAPAEEQKYPELANRNLLNERLESHRESMTKQGELKSKLKELNELPLDKSIRRGILMSRLYNNYDNNNNNKDQDNSNNIMEQQIRNSTEYINAQAALEQQRLLRRRRNGNNQSD